MDDWTMAKLLVLYMSRDDENEFLDYLRSLGILTILPATSTSTDFTTVGVLPEPSDDETTRRFFLHFSIVGMPLITEYDPDKNYYVIDGYQSPVFEFWRSWMVADTLMPGGLEAEMMWIDVEKQDLAKKPKEFRELFESMESWVHKNFVRLGIHVFAGTGAISLRNDGGTLQGR